jgi:hypothetical protein
MTERRKKSLVDRLARQAERLGMSLTPMTPV